MSAILVVDDDPDFRATLGEIVRNAGFSATLVGSGREALTQVNNERYEIVILDMVMPGMNGLETLRDLRKTAPHAKVIMLTAFSTIESAVAAIKLGASEYIAKPFHVNDFVNLLRRTQEEVKFERGVESLNLDHILGALSNSIRRTTIGKRSGNPIFSRRATSFKLTAMFNPHGGHGDGAGNVGGAAAVLAHPGHGLAGIGSWGDGLCP